MLITYQDKGDFIGADDDDCSVDIFNGCLIEILRG